MSLNFLNGLLALAASLLPLAAVAQGISTSAEMSPQAMLMAHPEALVEPQAQPHSLEIYTSRHRLTAGYADWSEVGLRGSYEFGANLLHMEVASMRRFAESGVYIGLGNTVTISPEWFATLSAGAGDGASYLPRYRIDGFVNRKFLAEKNLIGTLGVGYYRAPDGHVDRSASLGGTYYFSQPWIVQAEIKFNTSNPGSVRTRQQAVAVTWGYDKKTQVTGRYAAGTEGYQSIGAGASLVDFRSSQASVTVRQWVNAYWGISANAEHYKNPLYQRTGINLGLFRQFQ